MLLQNPIVMALNEAFAADLAFAYTFFDDATSRAMGAAQGTWDTFAHPVQTFGNAVDATSNFIANGMAERDADG